jgi:hypothetical protein
MGFLRLSRYKTFLETLECFQRQPFNLDDVGIIYVMMIEK